MSSSITFDDHYVMTLGGDAVTTDRTASVVNPATGEEIGSVPVATREDLDRTVAAARAAFPGWAATPVEERQRIVSAMGDRMEEHAEEFMALLTREQGKPRAGAEWEVYGTIAWFREISKQSLPEEVLLDTLDRTVVTRWTPLGVVGGITPWNFPILLAVWKIAPALVAGNCIVVKPSPYTPLCTLKLAELVADIAPPGVFNVISGDDDLGKWMTSHPDIDKIAFTGNTETGKDVMRAAAGTLKRLTLELGGNDPAIVLADVDPAKVAPQLFWAAFQNNAQFCNAAKRVYIHEDAYEAVRDALVEYAKTVKVGDGREADTDLGPIQNAPQYAKVKEYFDDCRAQGYTFALGGDIDEDSPGWFVPVTIVDDPPERSRLMVEEPFGPILPLVRWRDEDDVVRRANDTPWGLGATVWGKDLEAVERIGRQMEAGTVWINEVHQYAPNQHFGGHKQSGIGCENAIDGLAEYTNWQSLCINRAADAV
jgi:acyl-CoA reductase-like NAD-dependent aldehyde dehydrogenase